MASGRVIDVSALLDGRRLNRFNYGLIAISFLVTLFDGLDMMMVGFTAPYMKEALHLSDTMLGNVFSAGILGMMLGSFLFSHLADRIGRRPAIVGAALAFGLLTMATAFARSYPALLAMRFLDGLAIGGMLPVAWALNIEFVPRAMRASVVTVIMFGYSLGAAIAGPLTNLIAPGHGWPAVYLACGGATLLAAVLLILFLPESIRFLVARGTEGARVAGLIARLEPGHATLPGDRFRLDDEPAPDGGVRLRDLFAGRLRVVTPLIWLGYTASSLAIYFIASWSPLLIEALDYPRSLAATIASASALCGAVAGIVLMRFTDRLGPIAVAVYPCLAAAVLLAIGLGAGPHGGLIALLFLSGLFVNGGHYGILSLTGLYYPSALRARGAGWATGVAKLGGIAGPIVGGLLLASGFAVRDAYGLLALCPALLAASALGIAAAIRRPSTPNPEEPRHA